MKNNKTHEIKYKILEEYRINIKEATERSKLFVSYTTVVKYFGKAFKRQNFQYLLSVTRLRNWL